MSDPSESSQTEITQSEGNSYCNRWYDSLPDMVKFVDLVAGFPPAFESIICEACYQLMDDQFDLAQLASGVRSMGPERLRRYQLSKNKRRAYDRQPMMHKTMNYLGLLSEVNRKAITSQAFELIDVDLRYLHVCQTNEEEATLEGIRNVTQTFLKEGGDEARALVRRVEIAFSLRSLKSKKNARPIQPKTDVSFDESGKITDSSDS